MTMLLERNTPSSTNGLELMVGLVTSLSAVAEAAKDCRVLIWNVGKRVRDERLVLDLCGYSHRASGGVVRRTNHEPISDDWKSTEGDRGGCTMASKGGLSAQLVRVLERTMLRTMILQTQELQQSVGRQRGTSCL